MDDHTIPLHLSPTENPVASRPPERPPVGRHWTRFVVAVASALFLVVAIAVYLGRGYLFRHVPGVAAPSQRTIEPTQPPIVEQVDWPSRSEDTDGDGLADEEEAKLGTDPQNTDADGDGLFDGEEVKVWKTNPKNTDTDGDGHKDGEEVRRGDNPSGPGRLVPQLIK